MAILFLNTRRLAKQELRELVASCFCDRYGHPRMRNANQFPNVFVLNTGRCGSVTFSRACEHFTNYSSGHETLSREFGRKRLDYPMNHIETDNRLAWFLGRLNKRFGSDAFYVYLFRDSDKVAKSYDKRWDSYVSLVSAFNHGG